MRHVKGVADDFHICCDSPPGKLVSCFKTAPQHFLSVSEVCIGDNDRLLRASVTDHTIPAHHSALDDQLIRDIAECCMSKYVNIRRAAQKALESITHLYDGARTLLLPTFFEALKRESRAP